MGLMRFTFPPGRIGDETVEQAYVSGFDRIPWQVRVRRTDGELVLERATSDSGNLHIPWQVEGHGQVTLSTATLTERPEAYHLPLELARGKIGQVRSQLAEWEMSGLAVPKPVHEKVAEALGYFAQAAVVGHDSKQSVRLAEEAVRLALDAANLLAACYAEQSLESRRSKSQRLGTFLGAELGASPLDAATARLVLETFNTANVPLVWREIETSEGHYCWETSDKQVEWCRREGLTLCAGPLLQFDTQSLPDWLALYEDDFDSLCGFAAEFVKAAVARYRGRVDVWRSAGRVNTADVLLLSEEDKVRLAARAVELTHALDAETPVLVSFDQPWAEYLSRREMDFPPLHIADALVRANLGLSGLMLEINMGYHPGGTLLRDPLEFSRQLDYWNLLGVPLFLSLSVPSAGGDDPLAWRPAKLPSGSWTEESQRAWVARHVPLLLAKPFVHGILWNQLRDSEPHAFAHGGLFDLKRRPKPALRQLASLRQAHLK
ncbi:MAG: hypothetical protein A2V98_25235 [Planctomycetes bacterium RBG_16_64_12]|nr:MAG: hypothetical protein A2V98_25235 [Planctomycetes bacterium RBG_16_64_12]